MGTRGLRIVRFRGRYWCFYNHWDSYYKGMGNSLVESIPVDPEEYKKWLQALREHFVKWDALLQKFLSVHSEHLHIAGSDKTMVRVLDEAFDGRLVGLPTSDPGFTDADVEYTYTFDIDQEIFSVDNTAHFPLQHIPRNSGWIGALCQDPTDRCFVHPRLAPEESLASLAIDNRTLSPSDMEYWESLPTRLVAPKAYCAHVSARLRLKLFDILEDSQIRNLRVTLLTWTADDLLFRELAFFVLCLAVGGDKLAIVDMRRILNPSWTSLYSTMVHSKGSDGERELISCVGSGFHLKDLPIGSAPSTPKYWFEGALICLVPRLDQAGIMEKAVANAVRYGRDDCGCASFNAVLISIAHLVLLKSFADGSVEHSPVLSLISTSGSSGLDARQRYDQSWLDTVYAQKTAAKEEAEVEHVQGSDNDAESIGRQNQNVSSQDIHRANGEENMPITSEPKPDVIRQSHTDTDVATLGDVSAITLQQGGEATTRNDNAGGGAANVSYATESEPATYGHRDRSPKQSDTTAEDGRIYEDTEESAGIILDDDKGDEQENGGDQEESTAENELAGDEAAEPDDGTGVERWETGDTFLSLISFFDAVALETLKPSDGGGEQKLPTEIIDMILGYVFDVTTDNACAKVSRAFRSFCLQRPLLIDGVRVLRSLPKSKDKAERALRLRAEKPTGQQLSIRVNNKTAYYSRDTSFYRFVVGNQWSRKSFCLHGHLNIEGLDLPDPFELDVLPSPGASDPGSGWFRRGPGDSAWDEARGGYNVTTNSDVQTLGMYWQYVAAFLFPDQRRGISDSVLQEAIGKDWLMPANTKQYLVETEYMRCQKYERFLLLRIKRASRYWDRLWDDIMGEMKDLLAGVDDHIYLEGKKRKQLVGAADPAVILAVGLEVRLFTWTAEDATLTETVPGRVYSVMDVADQKTIEGVLTSAVTRLLQAKPKKKRGLHHEESDDENGDQDNNGT